MNMTQDSFDISKLNHSTQTNSFQLVTDKKKGFSLIKKNPKIHELETNTSNSPSNTLIITKDGVRKP